MDHDDPFATDPTAAFELSQVSAGLMLGGRYRLEALLANARQVMSWRAADLVLSRSVLIHLLAPDDPRLGWVLQASRRAATVNDSRFLRVLDALEASGQEPWSFVVSEFAVGDSVQNLLADGPLTGDQAGFIVHELATALAPQHARGFFHRRLGPDSVIITSNGNVKITGFLVDAALRPEPGEEDQSWSDQEAIDTAALGNLLYAMTTGHWPVPPSQPQRPRHGLPPAPLLGLPPAAGTASEQIWPAPSEYKRAINPELSAVTMAILRPLLGLVGPSLHSADEIADSLEGVVGGLEAEESLENRVRQHHGLAATPAAPAVLPPTNQWRSGGSEASAETQQLSAAEQTELNIALSRPIERAPKPATAPVEPLDPEALAETRERPALTAASQPMQGNRPRPVPAPPRQKPGRTPTGALSRRAVLALVMFVVLALVVLQVRSCNTGAGDGDDPQPTDGVSSPAQTVGPAAIAANFDFDPVADGGSGNENSDQAHFAADGDPSTVWHTLTYLNNPAFGGLKPGAGMVFDLGQEVLVANVTVMLDNQPNALQLMVPIEADPGADRPPMDSVAQWQTLASNDAAGLQVTLTPDEPVTTRWVMVYFTNLPSVGTALYRSGIAETYVNRE